jgi:adenine-specific DNA-methyltransferase
LEKIIGSKNFSFPKSLYTVVDILKIVTNEKDIILDFFAGSGTTGHATLELNKEDSGSRQFIIVEQLDKHIEICKTRCLKMIEKEFQESSFIYFELKQYNEAFIEQIQGAESTAELEAIWETMKVKSFLNWNVDFRKADLAFEAWQELDLSKQKHALIELLNKNQLYVNLTEMEDEDLACTQEEKILSREFYNL